VWSFLLATTHGAGLMLWPVLMPLCFSDSLTANDKRPVPNRIASMGIHTLAMLTVSTAVAVCVYECIGRKILRHVWLNVDLIWTLALLLTSGLLLLG